MSDNHQMMQEAARLMQNAYPTWVYPAAWVNDWRISETRARGFGGPNPYLKEETSMSMLERLKNLDKNVNPSGLEFLIELAAYGRGLLAEYKAHKIPAPKWLEANLRLLGSQIKAGHRATQEAELRRLERDIEDLKSKEEKRQAKEAEAAALRKELGVSESA